MFMPYIRVSDTVKDELERVKKVRQHTSMDSVIRELLYVRGLALVHSVGKEETCPLCRMEKLTKWRLVVFRCKSHPDRWVIVNPNLHTADPPEEEKEKLRKVMEILFPGIRLRGPASIRDHWHLHEQ